LKKSNLHKKIENYLRGFYAREWLKGLVLFLFFSTVLFLFLIFLEWMLWIPAVYRTVLVWFYLSVIFFLTGKFVILPGLRYFGYFRDWDALKTAEDLGKKIPGLNDTLVNYLQLEQLGHYPFHLVEKELKRREQLISRFDFKKALRFKNYLPFFYLLLIPLFILNFIKITGKKEEFDRSYTRIVAYNTEFKKPAPFQIHLLNDLHVKTDTSFTLQLALSGEKIPEKLFIRIDDNEYELTKHNDTLFAWFFDRIVRPFSFRIKAGKYEFGPYHIKILKYPVLQHYRFHLTYPSYVKYGADTVQSQTYLKVPYGTRIRLDADVLYADTLLMNINPVSVSRTGQTFSLITRAFRPENVFIIFKNRKENLNHTFAFDIDVIPDQKPRINVTKHNDTTTFKLRQIISVSADDDYGLTRLLLFYKTPSDTTYKSQTLQKLPSPAVFTGAYVFPHDFNLPDSVSYRYFFRVYDNNRIDGFQYADSPVMDFNPLDTQKDALKIHEKSLEFFSRSFGNAKQTEKQVNQALLKLKSGKQTSWEETQRLKELLKRQQTENLRMKELIKEMEKLSADYEQKVKDKQKAREIKKRLEELKRLYEKQEIQKEIERLLEQMKKEQLLDKLEELKARNAFKKQSLERTLELLKRFYIENKMNEMSDQLSDLARKQNQLAGNQPKDEIKRQKQINKTTDSLSNEFRKLDSINRSLKNPVQMPEMTPHFKATQMFQNDALQQLSDNPSKADRNQQKSGEKLSEMSRMMMQSLMQSRKQSEEEDLEQIKKLIHNLIQLSFEEESLLNLNPANAHIYTDVLLIQNRLNNILTKTSDTLFAIGSRQAAIGSDIFEALNEALISGKKSLKHLQEKEFSLAKMRQHVMFQKVNQLIYLLNLFLDARQQASLSMGQGQGQKPSDAQLPDMIKKRSRKIMQGMQQLMQKQGKNAKQGKQGQNAQGIYQLYKEQQQLKDLLRNFSRKHPSSRIQELNEKLDKLSRKLLREGLNEQHYKKFLELQYELLKLTQAAYQQQTDNRRQAQRPENRHSIPDSIRLQLIRKYFPHTEQLQYFQLPLNKIYQERYNAYKRKLK